MDDLLAKREHAQQNVNALKAQLSAAHAETSKIQTMVTKWIGISEYLDSLKTPEEEKQAATAAKGPDKKPN